MSKLPSAPAAPPKGTGYGSLILGLLGIAFIVLKLTEVIDWSWWWVTAPFWGPVAIAIAALVGFIGLLAIGAIVAASRHPQGPRS